MDRYIAAMNPVVWASILPRFCFLLLVPHDFLRFRLLSARFCSYLPSGLQFLL
ncbi:hypothetical protein BGW80DRAFT_1310909 [Lactifluus volemus]|nr:hypothetical protein BGW80DRAFT_1310909 [Lactifluus volemus]